MRRESGTGFTVFYFYDLQCAEIMNSLGNEIETGTPDVSRCFFTSTFSCKNATPTSENCWPDWSAGHSKITTNKIIGAHPLSSMIYYIAEFARDGGLLAYGNGVSLHGSNPKPFMSVLGLKQTSRPIRRMSALPPKADISWTHLDIHHSHDR
jgi:hypothetical protein